jgi:hypothetical protein
VSASRSWNRAADVVPHAGDSFDVGHVNLVVTDDEIDASVGPHRKHFGPHKLRRGAGERIPREFDGRETQRHATRFAQLRAEGKEAVERALVGEQVLHDVVGSVERGIARGARRAALGRRHPALAVDERTHRVLLGQMIEAVPFDVGGVVAVGRTRRERQHAQANRRGHVAQSTFPT